VALYEGDFPLAYLRESTVQAQNHVMGTRSLAAHLLGEMYRDSPWYFYPVAFLYKTSVAFHLLMVVALVGAVMAVRSRPALRDVVLGIRAPLIGLIVFGIILLRANVTLGFRYAMPLLPLITMLTAAGVVVVWRRASRLIRGVIVLLPLASAASALAYYPHFLAYTSEYQPHPELGYSVFVDSSFDWGQGLLELRDWMQEENVDRVYLSYFGSALPEGYGIDYVSLPSFFPLPPHPETEPKPRYAVISATNLIGLYLNPDLFKELRQKVPHRVLGHTMFVYEVTE
jgi:hypothetical protein